MWTYSQSSGLLVGPAGQQFTGYAGINDGKNNPAMQGVPNVGPLPQGIYYIGPPHDLPHFGPYVMTLTPDINNQMFGRAGFLMHSDAPAHPGMASHGCIVGSVASRQAVWTSGDHKLQVTA